MRALVVAVTFVLSAVTLAVSQPAGTKLWSGRQAAIALTYDDALSSQLDIAIPQLDAAGLKGTFFLTGRQVAYRVSDWRAAGQKGHELGNHTVNHPCARASYEMPPQYASESYSVEVMLAEIRTMNGMLEALDGKTSHSLATPCEQTLAGGQDYLAPLQKAALVSYIRDDLALPPSVKYTAFSETSGDDMIKWVEGVRQAGAAGVIMLHGVGGDYLTVSREAHQQLVTYLKAHEQEIWTGTFSDVMKAAVR